MDPLESLLNLEDPDQQPPAVPPAAGDGNGAGTGADSEADKKRIEALEENNKNLQEKVRQIAESSKPAKDFFDKVMGHNTTEDEKLAAQEILSRYEADPIAVTNELIKKNMVPLEEAIMQNVSTGNVKEAMATVDKNYIVDWGKDYPKIVEHLSKFSNASKKADPHGTVLAACRLAGVLKPIAAKNQPPVSEGGGRTGGIPTQKDAEAGVNKRLNKIGSKKKDNVFGI